MRRIGTVLLLCVLLGFGWSLNEAEAFPKRPSLPLLKESKATSQPPVVLNVEEDVTQRTPNEKRWVVQYQGGKQGHYTELRPGLHYNVGTSTHPQYKNADPTITPSKDGAEAKSLSHPVKFKNQLAYDTPVIMQSLDSCQSCNKLSFNNSPAMIVYHDRSTGQSVVLARSQPAMLSYKENIATYSDAFDRIRADVRYTVDLDRLEQDVLLYEKPLPPSTYGLNDSTTVLTVLTRLFDLDSRVTNQSRILELSQKQVLADSLSDLNTLMTKPTTAAIGFEQGGKVSHLLDRSYVYSQGGKKGGRQAVQKRLITLQGIHFLSEEIPAQFIQDRDLPKIKDEGKQPLAKTQPLERLRVATNSNFTENPDQRLALNRAPPSLNPIVIDYVSIPSSLVDFTFFPNNTYFVTGPTAITGTATFKELTVIKFDEVATDAHLNLVNPPVFESQLHLWATFTSKHDDEIGDIISGSTGTPAASDYVGALLVPGGSSVKGTWVRYGDIGFAFTDTGSLTLKNNVFEWSNAPLVIRADTGDQTITLKNNLFVANVSGILMSDLGNFAQTLTASNLTFFVNFDSAFNTSLTHAGSSYGVIDSLFDTFSGTQVFVGTPPAVEDYNAFFSTPVNGTGPNDLVLTASPVLPNAFMDQTSPVIDGGSQTAGAAGMYLSTTNTDHTPEANSTLDIGFHVSIPGWYYSLLAANSVWIKDRASIFSGFVGVDDITAGPWLNPDAQIVVGPNVVTAEVTAALPPHLLAPSIKIETGAMVNSNVYHTSGNLTNSGTVNGSIFNDLPLPLEPAIPTPLSPPFTGTQDIVVASGTQQTLVAGSYRDITVESDATLTLSGFSYEARSITLDTGATLLFAVGAELYIQNKLTTQSNVHIEAEPGSSVAVDKMVLIVLGVDTATKAVDLGDSNLVTSVVVVPNGTYRLGTNSQAHGIFIAKDILIEADAKVNLVTVDAPPLVATPTINPNGGPFNDSVNVTISTVTVGATIHYTTDGSTPTTASPVFTVPFSLTHSATTQTVKAIAVFTGLTNSAIASADFDVSQSTTEVVTFSPPEGTYINTVDVTLSSATVGATIHYTTDETTPTPGSPVFTTPIHLTATTTITAIATFPGFLDSVPTTAVYTINSIPGAIPGAPSLDETLIYNVAANTEFLYTGTNPVQTGVLPGTIDPSRVAVVRGQVFQLDPADINNPPIPLQGVTVTILGHDVPLGPEFYGQTVSRSDGFFDMAVNGGSQLIVQYSKTGFLPAQRKVQVPWLNFAITNDVVLIPKDQTTVITLNASNEVDQMTIVQGSLINDSDGARTATLIFPAGTKAEKVFADGSPNVEITGSLTVAATEYTVGSNGPKALPAELPNASAYTYAAEISVDVPPTENVVNIQFNQNVLGYLENFLNIPVGTNESGTFAGTLISSGMYDRGGGVWIPQTNGRVVEIVSITGGLADLDTDGDGLADDAATLTALGITDPERTQLATLYVAGQSLWRMPLSTISVNAFSFGFAY